MASPYPDSPRIGAGCSMSPFGVGDDPDLYRSPWWQRWLWHGSGSVGRLSPRCATYLFPPSSEGPARACRVKQATSISTLRRQPYRRNRSFLNAETECSLAYPVEDSQTQYFGPDSKGGRKSRPVSELGARYQEHSPFWRGPDGELTEDLLSDAVLAPSDSQRRRAKWAMMAILGSATGSGGVFVTRL